ncbi:MAG TPA: molybdopterin molybdotransferase MoeA [Phenylobacterium sp.]|nr:molybdopterin molybdotransferase MoeA [Phenylobacterium sp.]
MIGFEEACRLVFGLARPLGVEMVTLERAAGRTCSAPVVAGHSAPAVATSAMDGYAVCEADLAAEARLLEVIGDVFAGQQGFAGEMAPGRCVRIFTGAPLPRGADRVVMQEIVCREGARIRLAEPPGKNRHVRGVGSDFAQGDQLIARGATLTPQAVVTAAAADLAAVEVYRRPQVAILTTGDELAEPGSASTIPGAIPESVSFGVAALAQQWGADVVERRRVRDDLDALQAAARTALAGADLVVTTGGASVGEKDFARAMFEPFGLEIIFAKVAIRPGKPVWLGRAGDKLILGLPGNPSAAMVTARLFLAPLLAGLGGRDPASAWRWRPVPLARALETCGERECFHRAQGRVGGVLPVDNQDSSSQKTLAAADLLIRRRPGARALSAGELVEVLDF